MALTGSFATLASGSAITRLVVYAITCAATLAFRRPAFAGRVPPALFTAPGGPVIPLTGLVVASGILIAAASEGHPGIRIGAIAFTIGAMVYVLGKGDRR